ncbi:PilW family protein [Shewanella sp.]|uniref:PilW family protein n=1 Tax=Shewanella sp. TaxID=50422 RepID=UPI0040542AD6
MIQVKQQGFSLVELMVSMVISLFLTLGLFTMFNMSSTNVTTTSQFSQLQENGRIALTLMERDLSQLGFMGDITGTGLTTGNTSITATPVANDCVGAGINNASFPNNQPAHFRVLWGFEQGVGAGNFTCFTAKENTDVIQLKRLIGPAAIATTASRYYAAVTSDQLTFFDGDKAAPAIVNSRIWEYQHHIYFINNDGSIPVLRRKNLSIGNGMNNEEQLVEGIENMRILYGFDNDGDDTADSYMPAQNVTDLMWDNQLFQRLVSLKVFLLVRSTQEDNSYINDVTYKLADKTLSDFNDHYRRKVVSTTIVLENPVLIRN